MYNLIQIQDAIKGLPTDEVMKYVNGTNPNVPSYLALSELNRRKLLQDTASEFYGQPSTVKDQIASSLTQAPQGVNPAAGLAGINPAAAPAQVNPTATPPQLAVQQPVPVNPAAAPQQMPMPKVNPVTAPEINTQVMARGGLATLPVGMFKQANYAAGGIVAFADGGSAAERRAAALAAVDESLPVPTMPEDFRGSMTQYLSSPEVQRQSRDRDIAMEAVRRNNPIYGANVLQQNAMPSGSIFSQAPAIAPVAEKEAPAAVAPKSEPNAVPANPNVQASNTSSGRLPNAVAMERLSEKTTPSGQPLTDEQLFARRQALNKLAGVSEDPYAEIKKQFGSLQERRTKDAENDIYGSLGAMLRGYAQANPTDTFGVQLAAGGDKMAAFDKETAALRDKQQLDMIGYQKELAKEEDSRKRGDVKGVEEARAAQQKYQMDLAKLEIDRQNAAANMMQAGRPTTFEQQAALARTNPDLFRLIQGQGKAGVMTLEEAYKTVLTDPMSATMTDEQKRQKAREIYNWANGQQAAPQVNPSLPPLVTKDGKTYILQSNGKYIEKT